jgi:3-deoxy-manno-octulosonate cytidylyltransferase (CMP-KDO synthetase)
VHPLIVIPARIGSTRIPNKPLSRIGEDTLIHLVVSRIIGFNLSPDVVVATDDPRVERIVLGTGARAKITETSLQSGTERVAAIADHPEYSAAEFILNVQGDQLFLPKDAAIGALAMLDSGFPIGTAAAPLLPHHEENRDRVKVEVGEDGTAKSFSREGPSQSGAYLHLGVYAYTREALVEWVSLPRCAAESHESLEQLRPFLHGTPIGVARLENPVEPGIDSPEDLARARQSLAPTRTNA